MNKPTLLSASVALAVAGSLVTAGAVLAQTGPADTRVYMEATGQGAATALAPPNGSVTRADVAAARAELAPRADRN